MARDLHRMAIIDAEHENGRRNSKFLLQRLTQPVFDSLVLQSILLPAFLSSYVLGLYQKNPASLFSKPLLLFFFS